MKSLSFLKKIALGSGVVAAVTPIALMSTSCAIEDINADFIDFRSVVDNKDYSKVSTRSTSFKRLLFGSKRVFNGNYILIVGSNMSQSTCEFFTGSPAIRERKQWFGTDSYWYNGNFYTGIDRAGKEPNVKNFGIFNVIDFWDKKVYDNKGHEIVVCDKEDSPTEIIGPFTKWTEAMINHTKLYNKSKKKYEWDEKSVSTKDYVRNDDSAKAYRAFNQTGLTVYPTDDKRKKTFDCSDNNTSAKMLVFVDGELQVKDKEKDHDIWDLPKWSQNAQEWYNIIINAYQEKEKPKSK